jgi:hypothetical protein
MSGKYCVYYWQIAEWYWSGGRKMYVDFASDWPAYLFMLVFIIFFVYIVIRGNSKKNAD